jgi:exosome complex RNA-binding protein Rrp4
LGVNGFCWVSCRRDAGAAGAASAMTKGGATTTTTAIPSISNLDDLVAADIYSAQNDPIEPRTRVEIARLAACIALLAEAGCRVDEEAVRRAYRVAVEVAEEEEEEEEEGEEGEMMDLDAGNARAVAARTRQIKSPRLRRRIVQAVLGGV